MGKQSCNVCRLDAPEIVCSVVVVADEYVEPVEDVASMSPSDEVVVVLLASVEEVMAVVGVEVAVGGGSHV